VAEIWLAEVVPILLLLCSDLGFILVRLHLGVIHAGSESLWWLMRQVIVSSVVSHSNALIWVYRGASIMLRTQSVCGVL